MIEFVKPRKNHLVSISNDMRTGDVNEVWALGRHSPIQSLVLSVNSSQFSTIAVVNNTPCAVFGLSTPSVLSDNGCPWLLGANSMLKHKKLILQYSKVIVLDMMNKYNYLYNYVHEDNLANIRWLKWLGFEIDDAKQHGVCGDKFHKFHMGNL